MININDKIKKYKVLIIDIDNTIYNYNYAHQKALSKVLHQYNISIDIYNQAKENIKKRELKSNQHKKELYFKVISEIVPELTLLDSFNMYQLYENEFLNNIKISQDMINIIKFAYDNNIKICLLTNYYLLPQYKKILKCNIIKYISYLITSEEYEIEKPNNKLINRIIELTKCNKEDILSIGDSESDIFDGIDFYPYNCNKIFVSISGKSGAGKTTLANIISSIINCDIIAGDGYHKYERNNKIWQRLTHYNSEANNLIQMAIDIQKLYFSYNVNIPTYNHQLGVFGDKQNIINNDIIIIEGLHTLYPQITGDYIKIKIFIDSDKADEQKIYRDIKERNKQRQEILNSIKQREEDYIKYIDYQKQYSNFLITIRGDKYTIKTKNLDINSIYQGKYINFKDDFKNIFKTLLETQYEK